jgi:methionine synthase I (cobalamin-dependent)
VLTDADIENYSRTIASLKNTADVNKAVMAMTLEIATRSLANQLNSLSAGGRDISKFESIYTGLNAKASSIKSQLGVGQAPAAESAAFTSKSGKTYNLPN